MTYRPMTQTDRRMAVICSQDGNIIADQMQHEASHKYAAERGANAEEVTQLRKELQAADEKAQGHAERCAAAVRVAEAASELRRPEGRTMDIWTTQQQEYDAALTQWERLREQ